MKIERFIVPQGRKGFTLRKVASDATFGVRSKEAAEEELQRCRARLAETQEKLWASDSYGVLLIFQAMDAAGKDGTIKFVMSGVNPQGCQVYGFKAPSDEELDHDFMWRFMQRMPERGRIGIFNRSYYEEVLVVRVHDDLLARQKLPPPCREDIWKHRFEDINAVESYLVHNGIVPIKFFLNLSKKVQLERLLRRLDRPSKNWKFSEADVKERALWDQYIDAYDDMLAHTSTRHAPWYVIPADNKWYTRVAVAEVVAQRLEELNLSFPKVPKERRRELARLRAQLAE
jgi:PPK2 family polyphosphate:nucleotide phosphotransferase